jgi:hypothetical protein
MTVIVIQPTRCRKRGNTHIPALGLVRSYRLACCARAIIMGPPYRMRWVEKWKSRP